MHDSPEVRVKGPAPEKGQHTTEVLQDLLKLSDEEIAELESDGVVRRG